MSLAPRLRPAALAAGVVLVAGALVAGTAGAALARPVAGHGPDGAVTPASAVTQPARVVTQARAAVAASVVCDIAGDSRLCSHGDDSHLHGASTAQGGGGTTSSTASTRIGCYSSGPRVQTVYARPAGTPDRFSASLSSFQGWAGAVEKAVDDSAHKTRGARHVRFVSVPSGSACTLSVLRVTLPAEAFGSFSATVTALQDVGLDKAGVKYLVWSEAKGYCGIATTYQDDKPTADNANNGRFPSYARVDRACWGKAETHELMHMLGAVQRTAPHSTQGMHCHDGSDVMCYDDGTRGSRQLSVCPSTHSRLLDCRGDDYFSTAPAAGSWLATHWNTASSAFLARDWTDPEPSRPAPPAAPAPSSSPRPSPSPSTPPPAGGSSLLPLPLPTLAVLR